MLELDNPLELDSPQVKTPPPQQNLDAAVVQLFAASRSRALGCLSLRTDRFEIENDPSLISPLVALLRDEMVAIGVCDENGAMRAGIALEEALLNALYHGNLGVSSDLKQDNDDAFQSLANSRRSLSPYCHRRTRISVRLTPDEAEFVIADEGEGFDTTNLPESNDPEILLRPCGRGLMLMRLYMDEVSYNSSGDTVTMVKRRCCVDR